MCRAITGLHANEVGLDQSLDERPMNGAQLLVLMLCGSVLLRGLVVQQRDILDGRRLLH